MRHALRLGEVLADETAEGDRAAAGHAGSKVRVGVGEEAARIVADNVETRNGIAVRVDRVHRRVNADTVHRAEDVARVFGAVEGCLRKRSQTVRFFAVVFVLAVLSERVVALDRGFECLFGETELAEQPAPRFAIEYG